MRITFDDVYTYLDFKSVFVDLNILFSSFIFLLPNDFFSSISQKYEEASEFVESIFLANSDCSMGSTSSSLTGEPTDLEYFLVYEKSVQVYFDRLRY